MEGTKCPNCELELEWTGISDVYSGDVLMTASCMYCTECLYVEAENIKLSK
jgi:hypothetical protein